MAAWHSGIPAAVLTGALLVAGCAPARHGDRVRLNQPAPDVRLTDVAGRPLDLANFRGRVVLLNFWATWCPPCVEEMPELAALQQRLEADGVQVVGLSIDVERANWVAAFARKQGVTYPVALASQEVAEAYGVMVLPTTFLIDRAGVVRRRYLGPREAAVFEQDIRELLAAP